MKNIAAFIFILLIAILPSCKFLRDKDLIGKKSKTMAILKAKQDSFRISDSIKKVNDYLKAVEMAKLDSIKKEEQEKLAWESRYRYNIIVGSFITPEYAKAYANEFSNKGYNAKIIKDEGSQFEFVSAEAHDNFRKAVSRLKQFQDTVAFDAWMYIRK